MTLLDTHALPWLDTADPQLGPRARREYLKAQDAGTLAASTVSFWEVALLVDRGRVALPRGVDTWRSELLARLLEIPLAGDIAIRACELGGLPHDPADRFIVATALARGATLMTADEKLLAWGGKLKRLDAHR